MVENFDTVLEMLAKPFQVRDLEWKPGALNKDRTRALALAYVESRAYIARLNEVAGDQWSDRYEIVNLPDRVAVICHLTVCGVTRTGDGEAMMNNGEDGSDPNLVTSASAQAFKRACVKFGLGAYLYDLPQAWCDYDPQARRIVNPPALPKWAVPDDEWEAYNAALSPSPAPAQAQAQQAPAQVAKPAPAQAKPAQAQAQQAPAQVAKPAQHVTVHFGRYNGKTLAEVEALGKEGKGWLNWAANVFQPKTEADRQLQKAVKAYVSGGNGSAVNAVGFDDDEDIPF